MELTLGQLIDKLVTESQKCWHAIDKMHELDGDVTTMPRKQLEALGQATLEAHRANSARARLITEIDRALKNAAEKGTAEVSVDPKSYDAIGEGK